ncbi:globin [Photobacterium nomapromontoriensis]|uniref:globin n=1 Tax=Photobacterium nomapromontoriensis TaxID=2910237 RepID=UPI003D0B6A1E
MDTQQIFNDSYRRCLLNEQFFEAFYDILLEKNDKFRLMFKGTDMKRQIKMLKLSIAILLLTSSSDSAKDQFRVFAKRHGPDGVGASPIDFDVWLESLLITVRLSDPKYDKHIEAAWRDCFQTGLAIMREECQPEM